MPAHKHAELMALYAKDAAETVNPWNRWEYRGGDTWYSCEHSPDWANHVSYRRKPQAREFWINIYRTGNDGAVAFTSYDEAVSAASPDCIRKAAHFREVME